MSSGSSEEKSLPASDKKIRDARNKGQVAKSTDMVTAVVIMGCTMYIYIYFKSIEERIRGLIDIVMRVDVEPFEDIFPKMLTLGWQVIMLSVFPLVIITVALVVITNLVIMRGFVFSADPLAPRFEKINPVEGLKRIFSMRSISEFAKSLVKVVSLTLAFVVVFYTSLQGIVQSVYCGFSCVEGVFMEIIKPLAIVAIVAFFVVGAIDVLIQKWLFRHEQRMAKSEFKREQKDMHGDPQIRRERESLRKDMHAFSTKMGVNNATIMIGSESSGVVGVRYVSGETRVPVIVCKEGPYNAKGLIESSDFYGIPRHSDPELAGRLIKGRSKGEPIPDDCFQAVADLLISRGLV